jgi:hypothetical protein
MGAVMRAKTLNPIDLCSSPNDIPLVVSHPSQWYRTHARVPARTRVLPFDVPRHQVASNRIDMHVSNHFQQRFDSDDVAIVAAASPAAPSSRDRRRNSSPWPSPISWFAGPCSAERGRGSSPARRPTRRRQLLFRKHRCKGAKIAPFHHQRIVVAASEGDNASNCQLVLRKSSQEPASCRHFWSVRSGGFRRIQ